MNMDISLQHKMYHPRPHGTVGFPVTASRYLYSPGISYSVLIFVLQRRGRRLRLQREDGAGERAERENAG